MNNYLIFGDGGGNFKEAKSLADEHPSKIKIFLGDVCDKGKDSALLIEFIMKNPDFIHLLGNHEHLMIISYLFSIGHSQVIKNKNQEQFSVYWVYVNGGDKTLLSYGIDVKYPDESRREIIEIFRNQEAIEKFLKDLAVQETLSNIKKIPKDHIDHLMKLPVVFETEDLFCSHAPLANWRFIENMKKYNSNNPKYFENESEYLWNIKRPKKAHPQKKFFVYGHEGMENVMMFTPQYPVGKGLKDSDKVIPNEAYGACIDTEDADKLTAISFPEKIIYSKEIK